ncbi:DNA polymerase delta, subunit 4-domain-containing protein [Mycena sp. CBHHK59/15]|nr:DNA polymerase delta, subunit 4-domain-containing protein [Mycena sp. CBHHK59/15]KAJ6619954.1 DNA polymerase delta, subunit 4-domain-containing protein [Mycena sp. CBHHK59/15]
MTISKPKTAPPPSLKQSTLGFSSSKRTGKPGKLVPNPTPQRHVVELENSDEIESIDDSDLSSDDDEVEEIEEPGKKETLPVKAATKTSVVKVSRPREKVQDGTPLVGKLLELNEDDPRWRRHYADVRATRGGMQLIHDEGQTKIHDILRVFDLSYEYGPCVGVTRLERWERASALGLDPPIEVRDILTTRQGAKEPYSQSVFCDEV